MTKVYQNLLIAAGVVFALFLAWYFSDIVAYLLVSAVLALVGKPIVDFVGKLKIKNKKLPRWVCAAIGLTTIMFVFYLFFSFFIPLIASQAQALAKVDINELADVLTVPFTHIEDFINGIFPNNNFSFEAFISSKVTGIFDTSFLLDSFGSITNFVVSMAIALFAISFITFFFMKEENLFMDGVVILFPARYDASIRHAWQSSTKLLMRYFIGVFLDMLCVMIVLTIGLKFIAGLDFSTAILLGLIAGILNVIPYIGPLIAAAISVVIALAANINTIPWDSFYLIVIKIMSVFVGMKIIDDTVFQPYIFANSIKAHPLEIFLLILIAGSFAGIGGMLIAIPAYTVLRVFAKEFLNKFRVVQKLTQKI